MNCDFYLGRIDGMVANWFRFRGMEVPEQRMRTVVLLGG